MAEATSMRTGPGDLRGWPPRRRRLSDLGRWPFTVGICSLLAAAAGVGTVLERGALSGPDWLVLVLVTVAVSPWLVDLLVVAVPAWVFAPVVIVPVAVLHDPAAVRAPPHGCWEPSPPPGSSGSPCTRRCAGSTGCVRRTRPRVPGSRPCWPR